MPAKPARRSFGPSKSRGNYFSNGPRSNGGRSNNSKKRGFSESIDISKFVRKAAPKVETEYKSERTFADFGFCTEIGKNLAHKNFVNPTPIQDQAIPYVKEGRDLIGLANTGTGKTAAFLLPLIEKSFKNKNEKVLIIAPTRELALQIEEEFRDFSWSMRLFSATCVGGMPIFKQIQNLRRIPNFIIGTPGRLKDLNEKGFIDYSQFNNIVLDEVDRMLDMGFVDEIKDILSKIPAERQTLFFSATLPPKIKELTSRFLTNPVIVEVKSGETAENVEQDIIRVRSKETKFNQLTDLLKEPEFKKVLIFSETKSEVDKLTSNLKHEGFRADCIHGDKRQRERARSLTLFKANNVSILVATDVAARGLDIKDITHVINYTVPQTYTDYIHRIGRTGRGNSQGMALTFV